LKYRYSIFVVVHIATVYVICYT